MAAPDRGDLIKFDFVDTAGHEQAGFRPALVLSPFDYNHKVGLAIVCAITSQKKGYPFEIDIPSGLKISGVVLSDQVRTIDWFSRNSVIVDKVPFDCLIQVQEKLSKLIIN